MLSRARRLAALVLAAGWCPISPVVPEAGLRGAPAPGVRAGVAAPGAVQPFFAARHAGRLRGGSDAEADACDSADEGTAPCDE